LGTNQVKKKDYNSSLSQPYLNKIIPTHSIGLGIVPFLPFLFDHPTEVVVDRAFDWIEERVLGTAAAEEIREHRKILHRKKTEHKAEKTEL
jgi:hypothetical protein